MWEIFPDMRDEPACEWNFAIPYLGTSADLDPCSHTTPCPSNATCENTGPDRFECHCMEGYEGINCEVQGNERKQKCMFKNCMCSDYVCVDGWMEVCMYVCMYVCVCMYACMYRCLYVCMYGCMDITYVCMYRCACMCVCTYVCMLWTSSVIHIVGEEDTGQDTCDALPCLNGGTCIVSCYC